jgi:4-diphosphocytidyl-2C-methyl-D-erythritol kinase
MDPAANRAFEWLDLWKRQYNGALEMQRLFRVARSVGVHLTLSCMMMLWSFLLLCSRLTGRGSAVFHVCGSRSQRELLLEAITTPIQMVVGLFEHETHTRNAVVSSEYCKSSTYTSLGGEKDKQRK